jgi:hypothetical protein
MAPTDIAVGLTGPQRAAFLAVTDEWPVMLISEGEAERLFPPWTLLWRPKESNPAFRSFRLSPLGLAVLAAIEEKAA